MANLPVAPLSGIRAGRRALLDLLDRGRAQVESVPQLRMPAVRWALGVLLVILLGGLGTALFAFYLMFAPIDLPAPIEGSRAATTQILAADGSLIEQWHGPINRTFVGLDDMSKHLRDAAIAAEDARFYKRGAVDLRAVLRATRANVLDGSFVQGASTIGQQYAKNVYVGNQPTLSRKVREARVAYRLERDLGKDKVLEGYLNTVYFGQGAYGVEAASKVYFDKPASDVTTAEAALLISIIRSPDAYSPYRHPARSEARRQWVLERMKKLGFITDQQAGEAVQQKPALTPAAEARPDYGWYMDALRTYLLRRYGSEKVYSGGLRVQTTLDPQAQEAAEATIANALPAATDPYAALASIDPATGYVRAIVGGRDYTDEKYNIALQGRRQPGSAFKPFVLIAALESGIPASAGYRAPGRICPKGWKPSCVSNYGGSGYGYLNLERATIHSVNTVYAQLVLEVGPQKVVDVARRMGIPGPEWMPPRSGCRPSADDACRTSLQPLPAMALGSEEVTPLELASAYATLAAGGVYREPKLVSRVEDANGRVLEEGPSEPKQVISSEIAETVNGFLSKVITSGTGTRADFGRPAAGKTGTAQDYSNAWFAGYTPHLATTVWMGHRNGNQPLRNVQGVRQVSGGTLPAEMWREYMKGVSDRTPPTVELGKAVVDGAFTREKDLIITGRAADEDGLVQGVELSIDGGPFASAGVVCARCPGAAVAWQYRSPNSLPDGEHVVAIRSFDKPGHRSEPQTRTFTVDTRPPALDKVSVAGGAEGVRVGFDEPVACGSVSPGNFAVTVDGRRVRVGSAGCGGDSSAAVDLGLARPVRGGDSVIVDLRGSSSRGVADPAGNPAGGVPVRVSATNKPPSVELDPAAGPGPLAARAVEITGAAIDSDGTLEALAVSVDGGEFSSAGLSCRRCGRDAAGTWAYRPAVPLTHGKHTLAFRSEDNAGVKSQPRTRTVTVDAVAPTLEAITATGGSPLTKAGFSEPISCAGVGPSGFSASSDGRRVGIQSVSCPSERSQAIEITLARPVRGGERLSLSVRGRSGAPADVAGNRARSDSRSAQATNLAPILDLVPDGAGAITASGIEVRGQTVDPDGMVDAVEVSTDDGPFSTRGVTCSGCGRRNQVTWRYTPRSPLANGEHTLKFRSVDDAGVRSTSRSLSVTIDSVPPSVRQVRSAGGSPVVDVEFSEPVTCPANAQSQFRASVGGRRASVRSVTCQESNASLTLSRLPEGGEQVDIQVRGPARNRQRLTDPAGNPASAKSMSVTAANQPPVLRISTSGSDLSSNSFENGGESITVEGTASDPDGTIQDIEVSIDKGPYSKGQVQCSGCGRSQEVTFTIEVDQVPVNGSRTVSVRARDSASALSGSQNSSLLNDDSAPVFKGISAARGSSTLKTVFSEPLDCSTVHAVDFAVRVKGERRPVLKVGCSSDAQSELTLRISGRMRAHDSILVEVNGTIQDLAGNLVTPGTEKRMAFRKPT